MRHLQLCSIDRAWEPVLTSAAARIEYVAVLGSFVFVVVESILRILTLALRELTILTSTAQALEVPNPPYHQLRLS